jgi:hypothetical protein
LSSGKAVRQKDVLNDWNNFLGPDQTNIDPRDGLPDPDRIWSADGKRSIRFGDHETGNPTQTDGIIIKKLGIPIL